MVEQEWKVRYNDFSGPRRTRAGEELPLNHTIEPEIAQEKLLLNDCAQGDQPVFRVEEEDGVTIDLQMS